MFKNLFGFFFPLSLFPHDYEKVSHTVVCFVLMEDAADSGLYPQTSFHAGNCRINQPMLLIMENSAGAWDHLPKMKEMWKSN